MDELRQQHLSATMGAVRERIVRDLRAAGDGAAPSARTLSMALEMLELLWSELRRRADERERRAKQAA